MSSLAAALVALVLLTGSSTDAEIATPPDTPVGEVSGRVLYAEDEFPSAFVLVFLESETSEWMSDALSEEDGSFVFSQVPIGRYKLYAFETGYVSNAFVGLMVPTTGRRSLELRLEISDAESQEISCDFSHLWRHLGNVHHLQERFLAPEQPFVLSSDRSRSRLPLTLDAASPPLVRELLRRDGRPNEELSRVEELINAYPGSTPIVEAFDGHAALVDVELAPCPWAPGQLLLRTSLRARPLGERPLPSRHLFVLAESTLAMGTQARWPLMRSELHRLVESLRPDDRLTLITTSDDAAQLRLDAVSGAEHETARKVIDSLTPSGHGDLETGLVALHESLGRRSREKRLRHACLFTAGLAAHEGPRAGELGWIRQARKATGVPLTVVGFEPNDWDSWWAPAVAQAGGGRYLVLDDEDASQQVLDRELGARLVTVARDARLELRCSTERVVSHRLLHGNRPLELGERPRLLRPRPTDLGAGETLVFLHQLAPTEPPAPDSVSLGTVELRYRDPSTRKRHRVVVPIPPAHETFAQASSDFRLSAAAGGFGLLLARSLHAIGLDWALVESIALPREASENSPSRSELLDLIRRARSFDGHVVDEAEE